MVKSHFLFFTLMSLLCLSCAGVPVLAEDLAVKKQAAEGKELSLAKKAAVFEYDMQARFLLDGQALCKLRLPTAGRDFVTYNMPDNAYMTGIYLGTLAMKYAVTGDPADRAAAQQLIRALHLLCTVSGKKGLLARAAWPVDKPMDDDGIWRTSPDGKYRWRGDVSSDQVNGMMFGYPLAYDLVADEKHKAVIAEDVTMLVDYILKNDLRIIGYDGKPTTWGNYYPHYVKFEENMNALLWLQALKVAEHVTGKERYAKLYRKWALDEGYAKIAVGSRYSNPSLVNHDDDVSIFLAYEPLLRHETDPKIRQLYLESLRRAWEGDGKYPGVKPEENPFFAFIVAKHLGDASEMKAGINTLRWFPLDMKLNKATLAKFEKQFDFKYDPTPKSPEPKKGQPVPVDRRVKSWSAWVMDPYNNAGSRGADYPVEFNGHDYLLTYWMGRYYGFISAGQ
jgi:hypothetical protein